MREVSPDGRGKQELDNGDLICQKAETTMGFKLKKGLRSIYILEKMLQRIPEEQISGQQSKLKMRGSETKLGSMNGKEVDLRNVQGLNDDEASLETFYIYEF